MKKECASTRRLLRKYLHGHLFQLQKMKVERHLKTCVVCSSQYQALKQENETRQILKDITPPEGLVQHLKEGVSGLTVLKKLLYRPLLLAAISGVVVLIVINVASRHRDMEIDNLERSLPPSKVPAAVITSTPSATTATAAPSPASPLAPAPQTPVIEPLTITVTAANERTARQRINEAMLGHGALRNLRLSDTQKEIAGSLTARELLALFNRIETVGRVRYNRKRFDSFPTEQTVPFILKVRPAPKTAERPTVPSAPKVYQPVESPAAPASAPSQTTLP